jgi:1,5-anhydro-D-fructose reductase (1,5-anhydro-D-mannitol-forming)
MALTYVGPAILASGHTIVGVSGSSSSRVRAVAAALGNATAYRSIRDMLWGGQLDAVYISCANEHHADQTIAAAEAGVHVLCEKPLAPDLNAARAMILACRKADVVFATNHHLRSSPRYRRVREFIARGRIGTPLAIRAQHAVILDRVWSGWRQSDARSGGVFLDLTVHSVDLLRFLLSDDDVIGVTACSTAGSATTSGAPEQASMTILAFESGLLASCHEAFNIPYATNTIEVFGTEAALVITNPYSWHSGPDVCLRDDRREVLLELPAVTNLYCLVISQFADAVLERAAPDSTGLDGFHSLAAAVAAKESAQSGGSVRPAVPPLL